MHSNHFFRALFRDGQSFVKLNAFKTTAPHFGIVLSRVIDKHMAHHRCGYGDEMLVILPIDVVLGQTQVCFVD